MPTKILLIAVVNKEKHNPYYPIGLYTLKTFLENNHIGKCDIKIFDLSFYSYSEITSLIYSWKPDIVGMSVDTGCVEILYDFMQCLNNSLPKDSNILYVIGKYAATFTYMDLLKMYPKVICVRGEGELALSGLIDFINGEKQLKEVNNISYIDKQTGVIINTEPAVISNFEQVGLIDHKDAKKYYEEGGDIWIETSRGCPWGKCSHCSIAQLENKFARRNKPINMIITELKQIVAIGIERVTFSDSEFIGHSIMGVIRAMEIAKRIIANNIKISFHLDMRISSIVDKNDTPKERQLRIQMLELLKNAGLRTVYIGIETGSSTQLKRYNKGTNIQIAEEAIALCRKLDLNMAIGFIILDPLVSKKEIIENITFISRNHIEGNLSFPLNKLRCYPGIPYIAMIKNEEMKLGKKLISQKVDMHTLDYKVVDYKYPNVKIISKFASRYVDGEYDLYNTIRWFERFNDKIFGIELSNEFVYLASAQKLIGIF